MLYQQGNPSLHSSPASLGPPTAGDWCQQGILSHISFSLLQTHPEKHWLHQQRGPQWGLNRPAGPCCCDVTLPYSPVAKSARKHPKPVTHVYKAWPRKECKRNGRVCVEERSHLVLYGRVVATGGDAICAQCHRWVNLRFPRRWHSKVVAQHNAANVLNEETLLSIVWDKIHPSKSVLSLFRLL